MRINPLLLLAVGIVCLPLDVGRAAENALVGPLRTLTGLQARVVAGDAHARDESVRQLRRIDLAIGALAPEELAEEENQKQIVLYLLAGGSPKSVRKLFADGILEGEKAPLVAAALAYAEGNRKDAAAKFEKIDPRTYPNRLGGHIALVKGGLLLGVDRPRAIENLDWARLAMPGSLVEEAALRREVVSIDFMSDQRRYLMLVRRYSQLYSRSPFADSFNKYVLKRVADNTLKMDESSVDKFAGTLALSGASPALEWRLGVARKAIREGRMGLAGTQLSKAEPLAAAAGTPGRMSLYHAARKAMDGKLDEAAAELGKVDSGAMSADEQLLKQVIESILVRLTPNLNDPQAAATLSASESQQGAAKGPSSGVATAAQRSLEAADEFLKGRGRL